MLPSKPRILIVTASFGEGHHSAAKNLALAFGEDALCKIADPCFEANPKFNKQLSKGYQAIINYTPYFWSLLYYSTDFIDLNRPSKVLTRRPEQTLHKHIQEFKPDAIISTYPLYPYYIKRIFDKLPKVPVFTFITDSIRINKAWTNAPTDYFLVSDEYTKNMVINRTHHKTGQVHSCGFPVHPHFKTLKPIPASDNCTPFKILYFATGRKTKLPSFIRALLKNQNNHITVTIILGKNFRKLFAKSRDIQSEFPNRVSIRGWTKKIPELMTTHHLVISKAGGATTHEAIAATTPMLIHYLLPGQEQGNLELLEKIGAGALANSTEKLTKMIEQLSHHNFKLWREMKQNLINLKQNDGAYKCKEIVLQNLR